jgi:hypothetical protein
MGRKSNLAAFQAEARSPKNTTDETPTKRSRGHGDIVAVSMRMHKEDWKRLHVFALDSNETLQGLFILSMSALLESRGLPGLEPVGAKSNAGAANPT